MGKSWKFLAVAVIAGVTSWLTAPAGAAPLASSLALKKADATAVESVQWRRWHRGRWIGPAAGFAAGVAIGNAFAPPYYSYGYPAYDYGYGAYAYAPGYAYVPARRYPGYGSYGYYGCTGDDSTDSSYPSWMCR